ncbi:MAG: glycosyltransferase family 2 protein [Candidatus Portnoybacteria bacterium]|nr:glycosyltransferase family 2 protein [Candidatus Portnoybacteria bacterium]
MEQNSSKKTSLSVIIPVFNEEQTIGPLVSALKNELERLNLEYEIIAVNDASTDNSRAVLEDIKDVQVHTHFHNKGYGAALKTGIKKAKFNNLLFLDADGQHKIEYIAKMLECAQGSKMVSGVRVGYKGPWLRQPGKKILQWLANYLAKQKIPDLNCGFRLVKKDSISKFTHLLCDGFSFSTTTHLIFINEGLPIKYVPITINRRTGKSKVGPKDAFNTLIVILQIITLFSPLRIFLPVSFLLFLGTLISFGYDLFLFPPNVTDTTIILFLSSLLIFCFGLLADQIAAIRREMRNNQ